MKRKRMAALLACAVAAGMTAMPAAAEEKVFTYGTTGYGVEMGDEGLNPHSNYSGWSCLRYGVGETLFKYNDNMEPEPWLAEKYEFLDENTVEITLREDVYFSSGRRMDGQAVKECLDHLLEVHDRAPADLKIDHIEADGRKVIIHTTEPCPAIVNYLGDPYGCIIDMEYGITGSAPGDANVAGTGPYVATEVSETEITLVKNENYWGGDVQVDKVIVKSIGDGDTLTNALLAGDVDATYGLPYESYALLEGNPDYQINSCATSRVFFGQFNYDSEIVQDARVREAICMGVDKNGFASVLLSGHGTPAAGAFPDSFSFGNAKVTAPGYDPEGAKALLEEAGWSDTDGDGYADRDGERLTIRWLTYPGRYEQKALSEYAQETLKNIGVYVDVNITQDHLSVAQRGDFDVYLSSLTTAPTGDPEYFFTTCALDSSAKNRGHYHNDELENLASELHVTFDAEERAELAVRMQQNILDDFGFFFVSHQQMSIVSRSYVAGMYAHPCDYYEITAQLDVLPE